MTVLKLGNDATTSPIEAAVPFSILPLELREQIYYIAITKQHPHHITISAADAIHGTDSRYPYFLPPLCLVNEATRVEVGLWLIRNTKFGLLYPQHIVHFSAFLSTFPSGAGFAAIRRLDFQLFGRQSGNGAGAYLEFMRRCTGLTEVRIKFEIWYILKRLCGTNIEMRTLEIRQYAAFGLKCSDMVEMYRLAGLFELASLTKLTVEVWPKVLRRTSSGLLDVVSNFWPVIEELVEWIKKGFEKRERDVDVLLVECGNSGLRWAGGTGRRPRLSD
jgi:hypothetical protein